ncbi:MAG TPA: DUF2474 domain-containing protein [Burkholderiaceae bacterium]|nr:DUF2474 domain-containing protein [Burkholderiaceae bacterium]
MNNPAGRRFLHWGRRVGWMLVLWALSVAVLGAVAYVIRVVMDMAGLTV